MILKVSTVYTRSFLMVLASDHVTGATGLVPVVTISKASGSFAGAGGAVSEIGNGWYKIVLTTTDVNTVGDLAFHITVATADPTDFVDQVQANILTDINIDASGNVAIASSYKKNQSAVLPFIMTVGNPPIAQVGLTVAAQRSLAGGGFSPCANSVTEIGNGCYSISLAASDTNASVILYRFTATSANDQEITLYTQP